MRIVRCPSAFHGPEAMTRGARVRSARQTGAALGPSGRRLRSSAVLVRVDEEVSGKSIWITNTALSAKKLAQ